MTFLSATPVGWVLAAAAAGGALAYGVSRAASSGGHADGQRKGLLAQLREKRGQFEAAARAGRLGDGEAVDFLRLLKMAVEAGRLNLDHAWRLLTTVSDGHLDIVAASHDLEMALQGS